MLQKTVLSFIEKGRAMARAPNGQLATVVIPDKRWHSVDEDRSDSTVNADKEPRRDKIQIRGTRNGRA
jgi:hypothetical protein